MRSFRISAALVMLGLALAGAARAGAEGERLVAPASIDAAEWDLQPPDPSHPTSRLWKRKGNDREHLRIEGLPDSPAGVAEVRRTLDAPGKAGCAVFDTTTLRDTPLNGYPRLLWRTDCERADGSRSTLLNLALRGREQLFLVLRSWPGRAAEADVAPWVERFERFMLCDDRSPRQVCPEGFVPLGPQ